MKTMMMAAAAAALSACAHAPVTYQEVEQAAGLAKIQYCALRPEAREALRRRITEGVPVVDCPGDADAAPVSSDARR